MPQQIGQPMCVVLTMEYKAFSQLSDAIIGCKDLLDETWSDGFSVRMGGWLDEISIGG